MPRVYNKRHKNAPDDAVYVGRGSKWGNPYHIGQDGDREDVIEKFELHLLNNKELMEQLPELRGKDLVCWCAPKACHADVLMEYANNEELTMTGSVHTDEQGRPLCKGFTKKGMPCQRIDVKDNGFCAAHQTQDTTTGALARSWKEQDEDTKNYVRQQAEAVGICSTCGSSEFMNEDGICVPCSEFYNNTEGETVETDVLYVSVTGHRPPKIGGYDKNNRIRVGIRNEIERVLIKIRNENPDKEVRLIVGGALGVDQDAARVAYKIGMKYIAYIAFQGQELRWPKKAQEAYYTMLELAYAVNYVTIKSAHEQWSYKQVAEALQKRNVAMIDDSQILIAVWNGKESGGTYNAVQYAASEEVKRTTIFIDPSGKNQTKIREY